MKIYAYSLPDNDYIISTDIRDFKSKVTERVTCYDVDPITTDSKSFYRNAIYARFKEYMLSRRDDSADLTPIDLLC